MGHTVSQQYRSIQCCNMSSYAKRSF